MARSDGWSGLFATAFAQSRNPMALVDERRVFLDVNGALLQLLGHRRAALVGRPIFEHVADGPIMSPREWATALAQGEFTGDAEMRCADGTTTSVQWAVATEVVTGRRLVLFVALGTSRWGGRYRRTVPADHRPEPLSPREREIVGHVAAGSSGPEIAADLQISHDTVRTHVRNAMTKTGARSRAHLVARAIAEGHALT